jgi:trehalose 6-phosphate phosphatase
VTAQLLTSIDPLRPVLERPPLAILSDIDGTVAPIVPIPEDAQISARNRELLSRLIESGVRVAFITGRALDKARAITGLEGAVYAGNHGLNVWMNGRLATPEPVGHYVELAADVLREMAALEMPGLVVEDKGPVIAFHYRKAADAEAARDLILAAIGGSPTAQAFAIYEGRKVIELRPPLPIDKGTAVAALAPQLGAGGVICLGDDMTDLDMFRGVEELRRAGTPGVNIAVYSDEAAPELLRVTGYYVNGVEGVEWLLGEVLRALPVRAP